MQPGKQLEEFVALIESSLAPAEVDVALNRLVFNDAGDQLAEFDIVLEGRVGSSSLKWLIECRDRPSKGAAPTSWIEQLVGRRELFRFDKVFAVSTTGFSPGAKTQAQRAGIVTRSVSSVDEIAGDFGVVLDFRLQQLTIKPNKFIDCTVTDREQLETLDQPLEDLRVKGIRIQGESDYWSPSQFVMYHLEESGTKPNPPDGETLNLVFEYDSEVDVLYEQGQTMRVRDVHVPFQARMAHFTTTTVAGTLYADDGEVIGQELAFSFAVPGGSVHCSVLILKRPDGTVDTQVRRVPEFDPVK